MREEIGREGKKRESGRWRAAAGVIYEDQSLRNLANQTWAKGHPEETLSRSPLLA